jgi:hypothetical protein
MNILFVLLYLTLNMITKETIQKQTIKQWSGRYQFQRDPLLDVLNIIWENRSKVEKNWPY